MDHAQIIISALPETRVAICNVAFLFDRAQVRKLYAMSIGETIPSLRYLFKLHLNACYIGDDGVISLAAILANNNTLFHLSIQQNNIRDEGAVAIAHMVRIGTLLYKLRGRLNNPHYLMLSRFGPLSCNIRFTTFANLNKLTRALWFPHTCHQYKSQENKTDPQS